MTDSTGRRPVSRCEQRFNQLLWHLGVIGAPSDEGVMLCGSCGVDWLRMKRPDVPARHDGTAHD